ncbi:MAG: hypothetical protein ACRD3E_03465 [Terriglobales bacterium]
MKKQQTTQFDTVPVPEALRAAMKTAAKRDKYKTEPYATAVKRDGRSAQPGATHRRQG